MSQKVLKDGTHANKRRNRSLKVLKDGTGH